jgi:hypothetical protein
MRYRDKHRMTRDGWIEPVTIEPVPNVSGMMSPVRCTHCGKVYDRCKVEVVARYAVISVWHCPGCNLLVDDRGETVWKSRSDYVRLDEDGREVRRG